MNKIFDKLYLRKKGMTNSVIPFNLYQKELGLKIKRLRAKHGLTQEQLAEKMGIATRTLCGIENGENFVKAETMEKICKIFDITSFELFAFDHVKPQDELIEEIIQDVKNLNNRIKIETAYKFIKALKID